MLISQAKRIASQGEAGLLCVVNPLVNGEHNNLTCSIKTITNGWITISCSEGLISVRAKDIETIEEAKIRGWR